MVHLHLNKQNHIPLPRQIYWQIRELILNGKLPAATRLPPSRQLAQQYGVARTTVVTAYQQLEAEGFVESKQGAGTFVIDLPSFTPTTPLPINLTTWGKRLPRHKRKRAFHTRPEIDFGFGYTLPALFPYVIWRRLLARYLSTDDTLLSRYGSVAGFTPLRKAIADYVGRQRGVRCTPEQVVIVNGVQQALDILARLLIQAGDEVLVETPGYVDAFKLFKWHGARLTGIPVDDAGIPPDKLPFITTLLASPRLIFVTPAHQFPQGGAMSLARRLALLQWADQAQAIILEDDYDSELRYQGEPLAALQGLDRTGRVIYLGTFSKVLFPALRLGYVILPKGLCRHFIRAMNLLGRGSPTLTQAAVADFILEGHFERHLHRLREAYGERHQTLVFALQEYLGDRVRFSSEPAGLHIMVHLDPSLDEQTVVSSAMEVGVGVYGGRQYHIDMTDPPPSILLGFSGLDEQEIVMGVQRLAGVLG